MNDTLGRTDGNGTPGVGWSLLGLVSLVVVTGSLVG